MSSFYSHVQVQYFDEHSNLVTPKQRIINLNALRIVEANSKMRAPLRMHDWLLHHIPDCWPLNKGKLSPTWPAQPRNIGRHPAILCEASNIRKVSPRVGWMHVCVAWTAIFSRYSWLARKHVVAGSYYTWTSTLKGSTKWRVHSSSQKINISQQLVVLFLPSWELYSWRIRWRRQFPGDGLERRRGTKHWTMRWILN